MSSSRLQLAQYIKENASQITVRYLVEQVAKEEHKSPEEINKEFGLKVKDK